MDREKMLQATIHFNAELNDFLPPGRKHNGFAVRFDRNTSIKHIIESNGVPHTEIDLILINGASVDMSYQPENADEIEVYPASVCPEITPRIHLQPAHPHPICFILDTHLGKLNTYLRLLGFDSKYSNCMKDDELAALSCHEKRILLTRDIGLLKRSKVVHGYFVRSMHSKQQLIEVMKRFDLVSKCEPFSICVKCCFPLHSIEKEKILDRLKPDTRKYFDDFKICSGCEQVYWEGSHFNSMRKFVREMMDQVK